MTSANTLPHDVPELKEVLLTFLDSASSLCEMMNATMSAVLYAVA